MPKDVHLDDISGIIDFMYYGEVAVPTADISRFLAVAEQFQVRGLVEDVPKVSQGHDSFLRQLFDSFLRHS